MSNFFNKVSTQLDKKAPFVLYKPPGALLITGLFQNDVELYSVNDFKESGFVFASFDGKSIGLLPEENAQRLTIALSEIPLATSNGLTKLAFNSDSKTAFEKLVQKALEAIEKGWFDKVVLSREEVVELSDFELMDVFSRIVHAHPLGYCYCWFHPKTGLWMGASPERLLRIDGSNYQTMALAGTQVGSSEKIVWQEKEIQEQKIVTDAIVSALSTCSISINVSTPSTVSAGNVVHIKTEIKGVLSAAATIKQLLTQLHPTPAICGFPKEKALTFINENEGYERTYYSGFFGELNKKSSENRNKISDLYVNLRCMKVDYFQQKQAKIYVGCGIVKGSIPSKEWEETVNKSMTMKNIVI